MINRNKTHIKKYIELVESINERSKAFEELFKLYLSNEAGDRFFLDCTITDNNINYRLYKPNGTVFSLDNIRFYDIVDDDKVWRKYKTLPKHLSEYMSVETVKETVIDMINNSTYEIIRDLS